MQYYDRKVGQDDLERLVRDLSDHRASRDAVNRKRRIAAPYEPRPMKSREILLSNETIATATASEVLIAKTDCLLGPSPLGLSLQRSLARLEGTTSVRTNGLKASYRLCCYLDIIAEGLPLHPRPERERRCRETAKAMTGADVDLLDASLFARRISACVLGILSTVQAGDRITPRTIIELNAALQGIEAKGTSSGLRRRDYHRSRSQPADGDAALYLPPAPSKLPRYLQDLAEYCNDPSFAPLTRSAIAHYQLEAIKAFPSDLDQLGRILAVAIWKATNLIEWIMPPFSVPPAYATMQHANRVEPYRSDEGFDRRGETLVIDEWVYHSACGCQLAVEVAQRCYREMELVLTAWEKQLDRAGIRVTRTMQKVLLALLGQPVATLPYIVKTTGCSPSTASSILSILEEQGIVALTADRKRNRMYEAPQAIAPFERIEALLLPEKPLSRDYYLGGN